MSDDLGRLLRAVRIIEKLAWKYDDKAVVEALLKYCSRRDRDAVGFVGHYLSGVWDQYHEADEAAFVGHYLSGVWDQYHEADEAAEPRCCECGGNIFNAKDFNRVLAKSLGFDHGTICRDAGEVNVLQRSDARYCSAKCRQRAYRKRTVTAAKRVRRRKSHETSSSDASHIAVSEKA